MTPMHATAHPSQPAGGTPCFLAAGIETRMAQALFDEMAFGMLVCDAQARVGFSNRSARQELASARLLANADGHLQRPKGVNGDIDAALRQACVRGRRSLVLLSSGGDRLMVSVLPLAIDGAAEPLALIVLGRRQACDALGLEMLAASMGLTPAERRVLGGLMHAASPRQIAADHQVSMTTVRTQISTLRAKMGARNVESMLLWTSLVPPVAGALRTVPEVCPGHLWARSAPAAAPRAVDADGLRTAA